MKKTIITLSLCGSVIAPLFSQVQAVYDSTVHQQMMLNHNGVITSHTRTREWLGVILEQIQINANREVDCHRETYDQLKAIDEKLGDPRNLNVNLTGLAPGQEYSNKSVKKVREEAVAGEFNTNCDAEQLYGAKAEVGAAEKVLEAAYVNYESVSEKVAEDKATLIRRREAIIEALQYVTNLTQISKLHVALSAVDSKLNSIAEVEKNAANKVLVLQARNEEQRKLKNTIADKVSSQMLVGATNAMTTQINENFDSELDKLKRGD